MPTLHLKKLSKIFCFFPILVSHAKHFSKENLIINSLTLWKAQIIAFELTMKMIKISFASITKQFYN